MPGFGMDYLHHLIISNPQHSLITQRETTFCLNEQMLSAVNNVTLQIRNHVANDIPNIIGDTVTTVKDTCTKMNRFDDIATFYNVKAKPVVKNTLSRLVAQCKRVLNTGVDFLSKAPAYATNLYNALSFNSNVKQKNQNQHGKTNNTEEVKAVTPNDINEICDTINSSFSTPSDFAAWAAEEVETNIGRAINMEFDALFPNIKNLLSLTNTPPQRINDSFLKDALVNDFAKNASILKDQPKPKNGFSVLANSNISQLAFSHLLQTHGNKNKTVAEKAVNWQAIITVYSRLFPNKPPLDSIRNATHQYLERLTPEQINHAITRLNDEQGKHHEPTSEEPARH
ncbi:hypothetical protein SJI19_08705 [Acerihabitans sp. TG2]|uniref:hypothetical protein n=1 Tax=Acerihabitans sp. TG2 TaxID=3096008 RepID=UPI002B22E93C|nr:hypothetical protein [Acerihabitans sp. TG2]MEA9390619.1 hypothetical protein [Acerihabitans sp. TG2]